MSIMIMYFLVVLFFFDQLLLFGIVAMDFLIDFEIKSTRKSIATIPKYHDNDGIELLLTKAKAVFPVRARKCLV